MTDVLLVGGSAETRDVLRALLRLHRFRVKGEAPGLKEAKGLLKGAGGGLVLLDTELSDGEWTEVLALALEARPRLPVVLVSPFYATEFEAKATRLGVGAVVPRPFEVSELLTALEKVAPAT